MARKTARAPQPAVRRPLRKGRDDRTASERFSEAYREWKDRTQGTQERLSAEANQVMGYDEHDPDRLQQQEISQFLNGQSDLAKSARAPAIAEVIGVRPAWLQYGFGQKRQNGALTARQIQALRDLGVDISEDN